MCKEESNVTVKGERPSAGHSGHTAGTGWNWDLNPGTPLVSERLVASELGVQMAETEPLGVMPGSWGQTVRWRQDQREEDTPDPGKQPHRQTDRQTTVLYSAMTGHTSRGSES